MVQLKDFPVEDHDDGPDALEIALRLSIHLWNGRFQQLLLAIGTLGVIGWAWRRRKVTKAV